ncbi:IS3 family transposase [Necropsobacter rosorum]
MFGSEERYLKKFKDTDELERVIHNYICHYNEECIKPK